MLDAVLHLVINQISQHNAFQLRVIQCDLQIRQCILETLHLFERNAGLDQIVVTVHNFSELWVIDHSTTTAEAAATAAHAAVETFRSGLDTSIRPRAEGEGRLGPELFARKLRLTLGSDLAPEQLRGRAWADYHAVRAEMLRLARERPRLGIVADQVGCPPWARNLAGVTTRVVRQMTDKAGETRRHGTWHYCDSGVVSWYDFARVIFDTARSIGLSLILGPVSFLDAHQGVDQGIDPDRLRDIVIHAGGEAHLFLQRT